MLILLVACADPGPAETIPASSGADSVVPGETATTDDSGATPLPDADADGARTDVDCDDHDPTVHPGAAEVCDGVDQDCDGAVDDGVPSDGAGCLDPGVPAPAETVHTVQIAIRTGTGTYAPTDDPAEFCLAPDRCWTLDIPDWNNFESGAIDVVTVDGLDLPRADIEGPTIRTLDGSDQWSPVGVETTLDGLPASCADGLTVKIGNDTGEVTSWTDTLTLRCTTVWDTPLTVGPMLGAVDDDGARIWYRVDATRAVRLRVASTASGLLTAPVVHHGYPSVVDDFAETVHVQGLTPETTWFYDLEIEGTRYGPWSFTTAPAPTTPTRLRFAFGSCAKVDEQPIFGAIAAWDPDVFLFVGDNHYGDTADRDAQRQFYREAHTRLLRRDLLHQAAILSVWDDHDYAGNNEDGDAPGKEDALRVFEAYTANGSYGTPEVPGIFSTRRHGPVAFFLLDDRYYRGLDDSILGDAQEAWLLDALRASDAPFKFVVSGSQFTSEGTGDSWAAFPEAQARFVAALAEIPGVVLLSGDVHHSELRLLPGVGYDLPELTSSPLAWDSPGSCPGDDEILACYAADSFIGVEVDATGADPTLDVAIYDVGGAEQAGWTIRRSELE